MLEPDDVATAIKEIRGARKQKQVAARAGINASTWSRYEQGHQMPAPDSWGRIVSGLECTPYEFARALAGAMLTRLAREEGRPVESLGPVAGGVVRGDRDEAPRGAASQMVDAIDRLLRERDRVLREAVASAVREALDEEAGDAEAGG